MTFSEEESIPGNILKNLSSIFTWEMMGGIQNRKQKGVGGNFSKGGQRQGKEEEQ